MRAPQAARSPGKLTVGGSTALQPLVEQAARSFQTANPGVDCRFRRRIGRSGRSGACNGALDIGMSDVPLLGTEITSLNCGDAIQTRGRHGCHRRCCQPNRAGKVVAFDREQMEAIFSGAVKNWSEVGGDDQPLVVINRIKGSGTRQSMANCCLTATTACSKVVCQNLKAMRTLPPA